MKETRPEIPLADPAEAGSSTGKPEADEITHNSMFADFAHRRFCHRNPRPNCQRSTCSFPVHGKTHPSTISTFQRLNQRGRLDPEPRRTSGPTLGTGPLICGSSTYSDYVIRQTRFCAFARILFDSSLL